ncbi:serine-rich coiled-coil domain-containing protein 2 [Antennarius striatus]|uniref:serine-rich coiled-coil domain-containing protein 2 n=1 Tax=Antennarius striatus TaxID=241820 RepID=UPI0035ADB405
MSAFSLDNTSAMPTMVSRLPKFGSRTTSFSTSSGSPKGGAAITDTCSSSSTSSSTRLTNGFYHHPTQPGVNKSLTAASASVKQNGFIRKPNSFSMKLGKENETLENGGMKGEKELRSENGLNVRQNCSVNNVLQYYSQQLQGSAAVMQPDVKKPSMSSAAKRRGCDNPVTSTSSPSPQSIPKILPAFKSGSPRSKPSQTALGQSSSTKQSLKNPSHSKPRNATNGFHRQPQSYAHSSSSKPGSVPGSLSCPPLKKKTQASRSQSSDSLGSAPSSQLNEGDRRRSRSLTHVRQQPSPTLTSSSTFSSPSGNCTVTQSYSVNKEARRGPKQQMASSTQAPPRGNLAKSHVTSKIPEIAGRGIKAQGSVVPKSGVSIHSILPPSALRKPLLPNLCTTSNHSGISYKLSRPPLNKQSRPLRAAPAALSEGVLGVKQGLIVRSNSAETPTATENSPEMTPVTPEMAEAVTQSNVLLVGEILEDMSLSSSSSLDKNDTSQEYMDDFDNLGNGGVDILLFSSKNDEEDSGLDQSCTRFDDEKTAVIGDTQAAGLCFLEDGMNWTSMELGGEQEKPRLTQRRRSSHLDYNEQGGSSLDLSPSDSCGSGGTYMWDEEGLEPLGGAATTTSINTSSNTTHHIGSFASDISSIDILNNLESCDLDDDDLMLDADVTEDVSLHSDGSGISHMAQWRRRQLCWGTQDFHNDNERSPCLFPGTPGLGLDVEDLAEDCSAVRSQLEYLQRLLIQEENVDHDTMALSPEATDSSYGSDTQVKALLQEVQQLREELRNRDVTIAQLTLQLNVPSVTSRCCCQEMIGRLDQCTQTSVTQRESVASQTPWREKTSQILHTSSQDPLTDRCPASPPSHALPLANPRSIQPDILAVSASNCTDTVTQGGKDHVKRVGKKKQKGEIQERRGTYSRSLQQPQPSKLLLFKSQSSNSGSTSAAATPPKTTSAVQLPHSSQSNGTSGTKVKMASGFSRLPKPKSY